MYSAVVTKDPAAVELEIQQTYLAMFPNGDRLFIPRVFGWVLECFTGHYRDYQAVDALYHDLEHTLQGTLCMARLLQGRHRAGAQPWLTQRLFELGMLAILLHDTGYLKQRDDKAGTGAKYTVTHVSRSAEFAAVLLTEKGFSRADISAVQNMIRCTGVNANLEAIPFADDLERMVGFALATADLLGQMAAHDYIEKLPILYAEFEEAARFSRDQAQFVAGFSSAQELIQKTPAFWEKFVLAKLQNSFAGLYRFLNVPYPDGPNYYLEHIEANIARLRQDLEMAV